MKKFSLINNLFIGIAIGLIAITSFIHVGRAANVIIVLGATNRTALLTNAVHINSIVYGGPVTNIAAATFGFFDAPGTTNAHSANAISIAQTNIGFTNYTFTIGGISNFFTNIMGFFETNFTLGRVTTTNAVANAYTAFRMMGIGTLLSNANNNVYNTLTFGTRQFNTFGLMLTNQPSAGTIVSIDYEPAR